MEYVIDPGPTLGTELLPGQRHRCGLVCGQGIGVQGVQDLILERTTLILSVSNEIGYKGKIVKSVRDKAIFVNYTLTGVKCRVTKHIFKNKLQL